MSQALRVGIVGAGLMGRWHGHAARQAGAHVTAVVDPDRERADALAARFRGCHAFVELTEALPLVDVVHVCTPTDSHVSLAQQTLAAGRHVLVEKPFAPTARATEGLIELADSQRVLICPVYQFLCQEGVRNAFRQLGVIGPLQHIDIAVCSAGAEGLDPSSRDRIALEILPHPLSLLVRAAQKASHELTWSVRHPAAGEILALTQLGEATVSILVSMSSRPTVNRMTFVGRRGTVHVDLFHGFAVTQAGVVSRRQKVLQPFTYATMLAAAASANLIRRTFRNEHAYPGLRSLVAAFYAAIAGRSSSPVPASEIVAVARAYDDLKATLTIVAGQ